MNLQQLGRDDELPHRVVERDDAVEHVVDLGAAATDAAVDLVDDTAVVVHDDEQYELALPEGDARAFITNGVLTITTEDSA